MPSHAPPRARAPRGRAEAHLAILSHRRAWRGRDRGTIRARVTDGSRGGPIGSRRLAMMTPGAPSERPRLAPG
jgi:hypothetical protein